MASRRSHSNPVLTTALRQWNATGHLLSNMTAMLSGSPHQTQSIIKTQNRHQASRQDGPSSRDNARFQSQSDDQGNQTSLKSINDTVHASMRFTYDPSSKVQVPQLSDEERNSTERQRYLKMTQKYGELGPGTSPTKSGTSDRREMIEAEQDIDGLPWEVRWKKALIPTPEEVISEVRDRFELQYNDPIEREQMWYLHWKDRHFSMTPDRLIWPQGYTDYLDHYDEFGRRRILPTDQKWSDSSWKHLADAKYRDRLFLMDSQERKYFHENYLGRDRLMEMERTVVDEQHEMEHALASGVVSLEDDQSLEQIAGTADRKEIQNVKEKLGLYYARTQQKRLEGNLKPEDFDPVTGLLKSGLPPLKSGLTVEEALVAETNSHSKIDSKLQQVSNAAFSEGRSIVVDTVREQLAMSRKAGNKPIHAVLTERTIDTIKTAKGETPAPQISSESSISVTRGLELIANRIMEPLVDSTRDKSDSIRDPKAKSSDNDESEGFLSVTPTNSKTIIKEHAFDTVPADKNLEARPEWYEQTAVNIEPLIQQYDLTHDPIESKPVYRGGHGTSSFAPEDVVSNPYFQKPKKPKSITSDRLSAQGVSSFDGGKFASQQSAPELAQMFEPLPLYREVGLAITPSTSHSNNSSPLTFKDKRLAHQAKKKKLLEQELMLPDLSFEVDALTDPTRGVSEVDLVPFDRAAVLAVYNVYRDYSLQRMQEALVLSKSTTPDRVEQQLHEHIDRIRNGEVGGQSEARALDVRQTEVIQLVFESYLLRFLADLLEANGNRATEVEAIKRKVDDLNRTTIAKAKVLGPSFLNFLNETVTLEIEKAKKNPFSSNIAHAYDKRFNYIVKPHLDWYNSQLGDFIKSTFDSDAQITQHAALLKQSLTTAMSKFELPTTRLPATGDCGPTTPSDHKAVRDAFYNWCRGLINFYSGKHLLTLMKRFASVHFRSLAENEFNEANDYFQAAYEIGHSLCLCPVPEHEPMYLYLDTDFISADGTPNPLVAEKAGNLEGAEAGWSSGSAHCWYPFLDETEYMLYNERRGIFSNVTALSERCLDNMNKKTHPSLHPFPEKALKYLEGAPLTKETAEHLWLRYMGMLYWEHAQMNFRNMMFETGRSQQKKALGFLYSAVDQAAKSLPASWKAPLATKAIYLCRSFTDETDPKKHLLDVEDTIEQLYKIELAEREQIKAHENAKRTGTPQQRPPSTTSHWVDRFTNLPYRIALIRYNVNVYMSMLSDEATASCPPIPDSVWDKAINAKARGEDPKKTIPELARFEKIFDALIQEQYCNKILRWREMELPHSNNYHQLTYLYFDARVKSSLSESEVQKEWELFKPCYDNIYTQSCIGNGSRNNEQLHKAIRIMVALLSNGSKSHKEMLLAELKTIKDKLPHIVERDEINRSINSLDANLKDPSKPLYCYMSLPMQKAIEDHMQNMRNPDLKAQGGQDTYKSIKERMKTLKTLKEQ